MESSSTPNRSTKENNDDGTASSKSHFQKTVCLTDWWLVKAENNYGGKRLAVAGFASRGEQALRVFCSAPIARRYDIFTLETVDGICIVIDGFMNVAQTEKNGFASEMCKDFVFGFPPNWETYEGNCSEGENPLAGVARSNPDLKSGGANSPFCPSVSGIKTYSGDFSVVSPKIFEVSGNHLDDTMKPHLAPSALGKDTFSPSLKVDKTVRQNDSESQGFMMPLSNAKRNWKYNLRSGSVLKDENITLASESLGCFNEPKESEITQSSRENESGAKTIQSFPGTEEPADEITSRNPDVRVIEDTFEQNRRISLSIRVTKQDRNHGSVVRSFRREIKVTEVHSSSREPNCGENWKEKIASSSERSISQSTSSSMKRARRKLAYESPECLKENAEPSIISPQSLNLNRSRSGRLLLPRLEFWRNQRAIYDADRQIIGMSDLHLSQPSGGSGSEAQRRKRKRH